MTYSIEQMRSQIIKASTARTGSRMQRALKSPYRTLLPWLMRRTGSSSAVDVKTVWGGTFSGVLPEAVSSVIWRFGFFDLYVSLTLLKYLKPGSVFIDVGAHFGYFSLFASQLVGDVGRVLSVEAMPSTFSHLKANIEKNAPFDNVILHQGAAFDHETILEFNDYGIIASSLNSAFGSRGDKSLIDDQQVKVEVPATTVDELVKAHALQRCDLVKIDAESSEKFVISGMKRTIADHKPVIITEVGDVGIDNGFPSAEQIDLLRELGYRPFKWQDASTLAEFKATGPMQYANLVFLPEGGSE